jgi:hypothetical protein
MEQIRKQSLPMNMSALAARQQKPRGSAQGEHPILRKAPTKIGKAVCERRPIFAAH